MSGHHLREELAMGKGPRLYLVLNKGTNISDSSMRRYSKGNGVSIHNELSDEKLVRRFVEDQDEGAFNELVNRYRDKIYRTALRITRNYANAEDVLQRVFIILVKKLYTFRRESKFSTWIYGITLYASYEYLRDEKRYKGDMSFEDYVAEDGVLKEVQTKDWCDSPYRVVLSKEVIEIVERAVNKLPMHYRVAFHLRDVEGLSNVEVAKILGFFLSGVKSRIHRARLFLRNKLSGYFYEYRK